MTSAPIHHNDDHPHRIDHGRTGERSPFIDIVEADHGGFLLGLDDDACWCPSRRCAEAVARAQSRAPP